MRRQVSSKRTVHLQERASSPAGFPRGVRADPPGTESVETVAAMKTSLQTKDLVIVDGFSENQGTIHATTITNPASQQTVVDTPPSPQNPPPGPRQEMREPISATGTIKVLTHAARGEMDGAVLDNGTIVHFPPPVGAQYSNLFQVGAPLAAAGFGTINTYGRSLEATSIGPSADHMQTVTAIDDRPRGGPGERPRPITVPAG